MSTMEEQFECMMKADPEPEHAWLGKLVGEWEYEVESPLQPGQTPVKLRGTETVRAIGNIWIVAEGVGAMPDGSEARTQMTLGYDPRQKRFVGTWVGSMMTHMWIYQGELDAGKRILPLHADGPLFEGVNEPGKFKDVIELINDNERTLSGHMLGDDGQWQRLMTAHYRRI